MLQFQGVIDVEGWVRISVEVLVFVTIVSYLDILVLTGKARVVVTRAVRVAHVSEVAG